MARPTLKTPEVLDEICRRIANGEPLARICRDDHMPDDSTVRGWVRVDENVHDRIQAARDSGEEVILDDCLAIADTPDLGAIERWEPVQVTKEGGVVAEEMKLVERRLEDRLQHRKLRIWTRLELLKRWNPRKYGDRVQHANDPTDPMPAPQWIVTPVAPAPRSDDDA